MTATGEFEPITDRTLGDGVVSERYAPATIVGWADALGIAAQPGSPLAVLADSATAADAARPDAAQARIVRTLAAPTLRIDAALTGSEGIVVWAFHTRAGAADPDEQWFGLWPEGDQARVTGPMTAEMVGGHVGMFFAGLRTPSPTQPIVTTAAGLVAAAVAVDAWRTARLHEWREHRRPGRGFTADDLAEAHRLGIAGDDGRWLTTMFADVAPLVSDTDAVLGTGLDECRRDGLVRDADGDRLDLASDLLRLADDVWFPQPSLVLTVGTDTPIDRLVAARGRDTVWVFVLGGAANGASGAIVGTDDLGLGDIVARLAAQGLKSPVR